ncbi:MAG: hypothetical protein JXR23_11350 [Pontiellaceae bacterium]|nr:hypothetical protein [Pontiellaceae bacterium]
MDGSKIAKGYALGFFAEITGEVTSNCWAFGDGESLPNATYPEHAWVEAGNYDVVLTAWNDDFPDGVSATAQVQVVASSTYYVDAGNASPVAPYTSWATAATNIQDAVDVADDTWGSTVLVADGFYTAGGAVTPGFSCMNRVVITNDITVQSVNGPEYTYIVGEGPLGSNAVRGVYMSSGVLSGFTITNGHTMTSGQIYYDCMGGGVSLNAGDGPTIRGGDGLVTNCILTGNASYDSGGGSYKGSLSHCIFTGNTSAIGGGGSYNCSLYNCNLSGNSAKYGGGMYYGTANNCTLSGNSAEFGGGIYAGTANNCTISGNAAEEDGGGMAGGTANNCILSGNSAEYGGGMDGGTANNSTIRGNSAGHGGGMSYGTADNCTISGNTATFGGGVYGDHNAPATANNCIVWYNTATSGKDLYDTTASYSCSPDVTHGSNGNITNAPAFVDAANGNYRLVEGSPCIDTGSNAYVVGSFDLAGMPRIVGGVVDMGAYEYEQVWLLITLPAGACEGDGLLSAAGSVSIPLPAASNLVVNLVSSDVSEVVVSNTVTILAGETNAVFDLDIQDDGLLDGSREISIMASLTNYAEGVASIRVDDNETTELSLSLPSSITENAAWISGAVFSAIAPDVDVLVQLTSDHAELIEGSVVTLPAGLTNVAFSLQIMDNSLIDGDRTVAIETQVVGWQNATSIVSVVDNEPMILSLVLPESYIEGVGTQTNAGSVSVSGVLAEDLVVELSSSDEDEMSLPSSVVIPAGESSVMFDVEVGDDDESDGAALVTLAAQSPGYESANAEITVLDNEVHHLSIDGLSEDHLLLSPVSITVSAKSIDEYPVAGYAAEISLSASGDRGSVEVVPGTLTNMVDGVVSEAVAFGNIGNSVVLIADGGGISITSAVFDVVSPQIIISHEPLTNILVVAGESVSRTMTVSNAGNAALEYTISGLDPSLIAYYPFNGNAADESGNGHDGTVNGAALTQDRFGNTNSAYLFDGLDDYIEVPDSTDLRLSGTDFSISAWFYETERNASALDTLLAKRNLYPSLEDGWFYGVTGQTFGGNIPGKLRYFVSGGDDPYCTGTNILSLGEWHHAVMTYEVEVQTIRFYVDGVLDSVHPNMPTPNATTSMNLFIGRDSRGEYNIFHGAIDDISIYNRALSEEEIQELYDPPTDVDLKSGLVAHYPFNGSASDESGNGHDGAVSGAGLTQDRFGNADCAYLFDGVNDYIEVPDSTDLRLSGTDFSISSWVCETARSLTVQDAIIVKRGSGNLNGWFHSLLGAEKGKDAGKAFYQGSGGLNPSAIGTSVVPLSAWTHVVVAYDLDTQTMRLYVNGVLDSETKNIPSPNAATTANMFIGRDSTSTSYAFHGAIDDIRIYNRALSGVEIESLYNEVPSATWLSAVPGSGVVPAGAGQEVHVTFDAGDFASGDYVSGDIRLICNDPVSPTNVLMASMLVLPPAPVINEEPVAEYGTSNTVSWIAIPGSVQYEVEMVETTNSPALQQSGWISETSHTFAGLTVGSTYCYRVRAAIIHNDTVYAGAWSDWTWSTQIPVVDGDGDGIPDWWEEEFFGGTGGADETSDSDGDGQSDLAEFIAGTNPTNSGSLFELDAGSDSTNDCFIVSWEAVTDRVYSVWWTAALTNSYSLLETDIHYPQNSYTDECHQVESQGFYKVEVGLE